MLLSSQFHLFRHRACSEERYKFLMAILSVAALSLGNIDKKNLSNPIIQLLT